MMTILTSELDRRREPRHLIDTQAVVRILGQTSKTKGRAIAAKIVDINSKGLRLLSAVGLKVGEIVKIDAKHTVVLGEVRYCVAQPDKSFSIGVAANHSSNVHD